MPAVLGALNDNLCVIFSRFLSEDKGVLFPSFSGKEYFAGRIVTSCSQKGQCDNVNAS